MAIYVRIVSVRAAKPHKMRRIVLAAIHAYQRYVSPYKGFTCAYREHTGRASCSALGYRAIRRYGVFSGLALIRERTRLCGVAHRRYGCRPRPPVSQRGSCDVGCDLPCAGGFDLPGGCDLPSAPSLARACDFLSCCDCGSCDWPRRRRDRSGEKYIYIPPNANLGPSTGGREKGKGASDGQVVRQAAK
jgi:uncharacterized protein